MNTQQTQVNAAAVVAIDGPETIEPAQPVSLLTDAQVRSVVGAAVDLSNGDRQAESTLTASAVVVSTVLGEKPSFELWTEVQYRFTMRYQEARECSEKTAVKRWLTVVEVFGMDKPAKPTKAAATKAGQRSDAAEEAAALIEAAKATTPAAVLALMTNTAEPVKPAVAQVLAKRSAELATEATAAAREAARVEVKSLRESIRKTLVDLSLSQLRAVAALVATYVPAEVPEDAAEEVSAE